MNGMPQGELEAERQQFSFFFSFSPPLHDHLSKFLRFKTLSQEVKEKERCSGSYPRDIRLTPVTAWKTLSQAVSRLTFTFFFLVFTVFYRIINENIRRRDSTVNRFIFIPLPCDSQSWRRNRLAWRGKYRLALTFSSPDPHFLAKPLTVDQERKRCKL